MDEQNPDELQKALGRPAKPSEMIFLLDGKVARLRFEYDYNTSVDFQFEDGHDVTSGRGWRDTVTATIEVRSTTSDNPKWHTVFAGMATCHPKDRFDIAVGRKIAIANMLDDSNFDRQDRLLIWKVYYRRTGRDEYGDLRLRKAPRRVVASAAKSVARAVAADA